MAGSREAQVIVLKKVKPLAPEFHRHIVRGRLLGQIVQVGQRHLVYEVQETIPSGPVLVTNRTRFEFC